MLQKSSHEVHSQYAFRNRILGGEWPEALLLAGIIYPLASGIQPASHAHWLFYPFPPSTHGGLISMWRSHVALELYLHRDRRGAFWQITCSHGDCRAMVRLICFFKTKLEIQILCYRHCVSCATVHLTSFLAICLCLAGYFHHNGARLTMWAWYQLLLSSDAPMGFGYMRMLREHLNNVCVLHSHRNNISTSAPLIS